MPFLGLVTRRSLSNSRDGSSIKEHFRKVAQKGPSTSTVSIDTGLFGEWPAMDSVKRHSIGAKLRPDRRSSSSGSPKIQPHKSAKLWLTVESPPLVSYNSPANSSGALFSAQLHVDVAESEVTFDSIEMRLICSVTVKKPVHPHCPDCTNQTTELKKWNFAKDSLRLQRGDHPIPFSYLFPGHLPATTHATLVSLEYYLVAEAKTTLGEKIVLSQCGPHGEAIPLPQSKHHIKLSRSVLPGNDKHSIRVFPPTNLTASVDLNPVIHPIGEFDVSLRLSGMTVKGSEQINRWRLRKLNWRIEEVQKMISPACPKHAQKLGGEGKGLLHEDVRTVGEGDIDQQRNPWKNDFDAGDVDAMFKCAVNPSKKPVCHTEAENGLSITHNLVVEMVVAEEWTPRNRPNQVTPTGAARILRTQFHLMLTERPGMGISWDEETPPVYEDVPESPPHYASMTEFDLTSVTGHIEELRLDPNTNQYSRSVASSSASAQPPSYGQDAVEQSARGRFVLNVDDLLSAPPERPESVHEEEGDDVQVVDARQMH